MPDEVANAQRPPTSRDPQNCTSVSLDNQNVVPSPGLPRFTEAQKQFMLSVARTTLQQVTRGERSPEYSLAGLDSDLREHRACFVTLFKQGELRGCIGVIFPQEPLIHAIIHSASSAATRDPRFPALRAEELDEVQIEISLLTYPRLLEHRRPEELLAAIESGRHGVVLQLQGITSTFLPQVWHHFPDKVQFMTQLARKAGWPASAWRDPEARISVYESESFEEEPAQASRDPDCGAAPQPSRSPSDRPDSPNA